MGEPCCIVMILIFLVVGHGKIVGTYQERRKPIAEGANPITAIGHANANWTKNYKLQNLTHVGFAFDSFHFAQLVCFVFVDHLAIYNLCI